MGGTSRKHFFKLKYLAILFGLSLLLGYGDSQAVDINTLNPPPLNYSYETQNGGSKAPPFTAIYDNSAIGSPAIVQCQPNKKLIIDGYTLSNQGIAEAITIILGQEGTCTTNVIYINKIVSPNAIISVMLYPTFLFSASGSMGTQASLCVIKTIAQRTTGIFYYRCL